VTTAVLVAVYSLSIASAILLISVALNTPRLTTARVSLALYLAATTVWSAIALVYVVRQPEDPSNNIAWTLPVVAVMVAAVRTLVTALSNAAWRPSPAYLVSISLHPLGMFAIAAVPGWHHLLVEVRPDGTAEYVGLFWVHAAVSYGLLVAALVGMTQVRKHIPPLARKNFPVMLASWSFPVLANVFTIGVDGAEGFDITPVAFTLTAIFLGRSMIQDGLADVIPVARVQVFESLTDGIFVLDTAGRLIDSNDRGLYFLRLAGLEGRVHGKRMVEISPDFAALIAADGERDVSLPSGDFVVQITRSPLGDRKGRTVGTLVHIRNVTVEALRTRELIRVRDELAEEARINELLRAELADQVVRDQGTGLHNRRFVFDTMPSLVERAQAEAVSLAVIMFDLDDFKMINDTYGHAAGDRALVAVARAMENVEGSAVVARFGGEEFIAVVTGMTRDESVLFADRIRAACAAVTVPAREGSIRITVSAGVAWSAPESIDATALIERADDALYEAKRAGRDRTRLASEATA